MIISKHQVIAIFTEIIENKITLSEADRWAHGLIQKDEIGELQFQPASDRDIVWDAIMFLYGIDVKSGPQKFMYSIDDVTYYLHENLSS